MAFVAEKSTHPGNSAGATPGWGSYSDLWVATADGARAWQLTDVPTDRDHGTIIPEFSPYGRLLAWTERMAAGQLLRPDRFAGFYALARRVVAQWRPADSTPDPALVEDQAIAILAFVNGVMMTFVAGQPAVDTAENLDRLIEGVIAGVAHVRRE